MKFELIETAKSFRADIFKAKVPGGAIYLYKSYTPGEVSMCFVPDPPTIGELIAGAVAVEPMARPAPVAQPPANYDEPPALKPRPQTESKPAKRRRRKPVK